MPKRPSAIAITNDDATIICADKFGDVYALPLRERSGEDGTISSQETHPKGKRKLSANLTTIHTASNQRALQNQLRQPKTSEPKSLDFSHQLLLGHVSMITDLALATLVEEGSSEFRLRHYIITCDRDEHIRISRGMPQSHVIEGYCLGHKQFVSRICVPRSRPNVLISGGGDDYLCVWDWVSGNALQRLDLQLPVMLFLDSNADILDLSAAEDSSSKPSHTNQGENGNENLDQDKMAVKRVASTSDLHNSSVTSGSVAHIAVTGIWSMTDPSESDTSDKANIEILVACEGYGIGVASVS